MKRVSMRQLLLIVLVAGYLLSSIWYSSPFKGRVVDEAGKPVSGAVVGIGWALSFLNEEPIVFKESITNNSGNFEISGWIRVTFWPLYRMVDSPYLYVAKQGYTPIRLTSRWISYNKNATPIFKPPILIRKVNLKYPESEHKSIRYFSTALCSDMNLVLNKNILSDAHRLKSEILNLSHQLPKWQTNEYIEETSCLSFLK